MVQRILIVDDEEPVRDALGEYFRRAGFEILGAANAQEALEVVEDGALTLIILDIGLAEENGLDLLPKLKRAQPEARVLMLTGFGYNPELMDRAMLKGADGYLAKGTPFEELLGAVQRTLEPQP